KPIKPIAFSPGGKFIGGGADDGILRVVELETGKTTASNPPRNARIETLAYTPNGKMIAIGASNMTGTFYAATRLDQPLMVIEGIDGEVRSVAFTADNSAVFACGRDPKVRL